MGPLVFASIILQRNRQGESGGPLLVPSVGCLAEMSHFSAPSCTHTLCNGMLLLPHREVQSLASPFLECGRDIGRLWPIECMPVPSLGEALPPPPPPHPREEVRAAGLQGSKGPQQQSAPLSSLGSEGGERPAKVSKVPAQLGAAHRHMKGPCQERKNHPMEP